MQKEAFFQLMGRSAILDALTLRSLEELIREYPYFQGVRMLHLKNLSDVRSLRFATELQKEVIYCNDRKKLFTLLNSSEFQWSQLMRMNERGVEDQKQEEEIAPFELINSFLTTTGDDAYPDELSDLIPTSPIHATDYVSALLNQPDIVQDGSEHKSPSLLEKESLIDSFIEKGEKSPVFIPDPESLPESPKGGAKEDPLMKEDAFLTESLARIYIKQKKYAKALEIIKKLSLKYPKKNVYFADQIRFLETIITNIKTE